MTILVLVDEIDREIEKTIYILESCGFKVRMIEKRDIKLFPKNVLLLGKHPRRRHNGCSKNRRRFSLYNDQGFFTIGYVDGAEIDDIWWKDLYYKIRQAVNVKFSGIDNLKLFPSLEQLKKKSLL